MSRPCSSPATRAGYFTGDRDRRPARRSTLPSSTAGFYWTRPRAHHKLDDYQNILTTGGAGFIGSNDLSNKEAAPLKAGAAQVARRRHCRDPGFLASGSEAEHRPPNEPIPALHRAAMKQSIRRLLVRAARRLPQALGTLATRSGPRSWRGRSWITDVSRPCGGAWGTWPGLGSGPTGSWTWGHTSGSGRRPPARSSRPPRFT